jgi:hypothetical protein
MRKSTFHVPDLLLILVQCLTSDRRRAVFDISVIMLNPASPILLVGMGTSVSENSTNGELR